MRLSLLGLASGLCLVSFPGLAAPSSGVATSNIYARLPLRFEAVSAQKWVAHGPGVISNLTDSPSEIVEV